jgi:hypothetical protein
MSHGVKYGVLAGLGGAVYLFLLHITGLATNTPLQLLGHLIWIGAIVLAHLAYKKANQGVMGYGKGLVIGIVTSAISSIITYAYFFIHLKFISSELLEVTMDRQAFALEQGGYNEEMIEQALASPMFTIPGFVIAGLVVGILLGVVVSLIVAAITKKKG